MLSTKGHPHREAFILFCSLSTSSCILCWFFWSSSDWNRSSFRRRSFLRSVFTVSACRFCSVSRSSSSSFTFRRTEISVKTGQLLSLIQPHSHVLDLGFQTLLHPLQLECVLLLMTQLLRHPGSLHKSHSSASSALRARSVASEPARMSSLSLTSRVQRRSSRACSSRASSCCRESSSN
ncbi:hypothetical protein JZ751_026633 [Albula glossodonta]|uniref:Uncharacterized protein n=1 Tax=Albula glossodonta TaxID=121402 RepID=A0A8T2PDJ5_9TELE|nr:hypothetical protein JZ751_026633 [Albula glossodonta]